ncbi:unnamed protein product [Prunus armeniaca]
MWDVGGDEFDSLGDEGVRILEIADLSFDEPSLEVALFTREDITNRSPTYKEGVTQMWDVGGDGFDSLGDEGVRMLEIANLSFDEPSLEVALFTSEDITNKNSQGEEGSSWMVPSVVSYCAKTAKIQTSWTAIHPGSRFYICGRM